MKFIIDTDPGTDDAVAILIALAHFSDEEILALTTVAGNVNVDVGTRNALRILEHSGRNNIPVYKGEAVPLNRGLLTAEWVHGTDGLNGVGFPDPSKSEESTGAVDYITQLLQKSEEKITICILGPMTNIGKVLESNPELAKNIEQIIFMGGGAGFGNHTPVAEFNILVDPEAAKIVLNSGVKLVMMGLDVTHQAISTKDRLSKILDTGTLTGEHCVALMGSLADLDIVKEKFPNGTPVHDAFVTAYLVDSTLTSGELTNVEVEVDSELTLGQTVVDTNQISGRSKNVYWMNKVDDEKLFNIITKTASLLP
jgi:purine nucleosidase